MISSLNNMQEAHEPIAVGSRMSPVAGLWRSTIGPGRPKPGDNPSVAPASASNGVWVGK